MVSIRSIDEIFLSSYSTVLDIWDRFSPSTGIDVDWAYE